ncbi:MAG TPA: hypothetical protein VJT73_03655 [Polyangiaceae bacterium]|nr:hypothetical protein [Polyangiaceae bacterium]
MDDLRFELQNIVSTFVRSLLDALAHAPLGELAEQVQKSGNGFEQSNGAEAPRARRRERGRRRNGTLE